jgi:hypothetical protein
VKCTFLGLIRPFGETWTGGVCAPASRGESPLAVLPLRSNRLRHLKSMLGACEGCSHAVQNALAEQMQLSAGIPEAFEELRPTDLSFTWAGAPGGRQCGQDRIIILAKTPGERSKRWPIHGIDRPPGGRPGLPRGQRGRMRQHDHGPTRRCQDEPAATRLRARRCAPPARQWAAGVRDPQAECHRCSRVAARTHQLPGSAVWGRRTTPSAGGD